MARPCRSCSPPPSGSHHRIPSARNGDHPSAERLRCLYKHAEGEQIADAQLTDWRKLAQGLHARYLVDDFSTGARFVAAVGEAGDALGHHPRVAIGSRYVDLKLVSDDAIYRDDEGTEHVVEWVTQQDVDLARRITEIAVAPKVVADPASVSDIELGLDTARSATIAPVWAALLTGAAEAQGRGTPSDEIRDATGRVPNLWFGDADEDETPRQRFHIEVYVAPEVADRRIAAARAAGGTVVDDSNAPSLTVIADQDGNKGVVCVDVSAAKKD
jgi:4a-hydroxytetrahydrobiopterin dehydratase